MNHLAHTLLAGDSDALLIGGLLGDYWRGAPDPAWPDGVAAGVVMHRRIDVYTDNHPEVATARASFAPPWRRYAGILLDVYFDHVLAREWDRHAGTPLEALSARVGALLQHHRAWLPDDLNRFARYFRSHGLFAAYARREVIDRVLAGIAGRLRHDNPLAQAGAVLWPRAGELDEVFSRFFPDLRAHVDALLPTLDAGKTGAVKKSSSY